MSEALKLPTMMLRYRALVGSQGASDPGVGRLKWNTVDQIDATELYVDWITDDGFDAQMFLLAPDIKTLVIQDLAFALNSQKWQVVEATNMPDWLQLTVVLIEQKGGAVFGANKALGMVLYSDGVPGPQGEQGETGPMGPIGEVPPLTLTKCVDCLFWDRTADAQADRGICRRFAPHSSQNQITTFWPQTQKDDCCGEGQLRK